MMKEKNMKHLKNILDSINVSVLTPRAGIHVPQSNKEKVKKKY